MLRHLTERKSKTNYYHPNFSIKAKILYRINKLQTSIKIRFNVHDAAEGTLLKLSYRTNLNCK